MEQVIGLLKALNEIGGVPLIVLAFVFLSPELRSRIFRKNGKGKHDTVVFEGPSNNGYVNQDHCHSAMSELREDIKESRDSIHKRMDDLILRLK